MPGEKTDALVPDDSGADPQDAISDAILGKTDAEAETVKEPEAETKEPEKDVEEKPEGQKAEKEAPPEKQVEEIPDDLDKIIQKFGGDPKEIAKAYLGSQGVVNKFRGEIGDLRKSDSEYKRFIEAWNTNPEAVIEHLQKLREQSGKDADTAFEDPKALETFIDKKVEARIGRIEADQREKARLAKTYENFSQTEKQRESLWGMIQRGELSKDEVLHLAVEGYHLKPAIADAKKLAEADRLEALAMKTQHQGDRQPAAVPETKKKSPQEDYEDAFMAQGRPIADEPE